MSRYAAVAFVLYIAAMAGLLALIAYRIATDATVPLFGGG